MNDYTMEDLEAVLFYYGTENTIQNYIGKNRKMTVEQAIRYDAMDCGEDLTNERVAEYVTCYQHGRVVASRFLLVESDRTMCIDSRSEAFWTSRNGVTGPVRLGNAGYIATSQYWRFQALKLRENSNVE